MRDGETLLSPNLFPPGEYSGEAGDQETSVSLLLLLLVPRLHTKGSEVRGVDTECSEVRGVDTGWSEVRGVDTGWSEARGVEQLVPRLHTEWSEVRGVDIE